MAVTKALENFKVLLVTVTSIQNILSGLVEADEDMFAISSTSAVKVGFDVSTGWSFVNSSEAQFASTSVTKTLSTAVNTGTFNGYLSSASSQLDATGLTSVTAANNTLSYTSHSIEVGKTFPPTLVPTHSPTQTAASSSESNNDQTTTIIIIACVVGGVILLTVIAVIVCCCCNCTADEKRKLKSEPSKRWSISAFERRFEDQNKEVYHPDEGNRAVEETSMKRDSIDQFAL